MTDPAGRARAAGDVVSARGVSVRLGGATILSGVDLEVGAGEPVALMGGNGSGKSTLVRALLGAVPLAAGNVRLLGAPMRPAGRDVPWHRVGYVPQRVEVAGGVPATAGEVVASGLLSRGRLRLPRDARRRALDALASVGLADRAGWGVRELSGGQQQRVLIARALVREPDLLVLDEPLAGVDLPSQAALARLLADQVARGVTVLTVLHELGPFAALVRRAVVLSHGAVMHDGAPPAPAPGHDAPDHVHLHPHDSPAPARTAPDLRRLP